MLSPPPLLTFAQAGTLWLIQLKCHSPNRAFPKPLCLLIILNHYHQGYPPTRITDMGILMAKIQCWKFSTSVGNQLLPWVPQVAPKPQPLPRPHASPHPATEGVKPGTAGGLRTLCWCVDVLAGIHFWLSWFYQLLNINIILAYCLGS